MTKQKGLVIFGSGHLAEIAHYYFSRDTSYEVLAFTLEDDYISSNELQGLPVVKFSQISAMFPSDNCDLFVALGYTKLNEIRKRIYMDVKSMGYHLPSYISSRASVLNDGNIGDNCFILEDNTIQPFSKIGNNVTLWSGNHIGHHAVIGDHSFLASHIVVSGGVLIGEQTFIGVNATIRDHIQIGAKCVIGAGALILQDADPEGVYIGQATERSRVPSTRLRRI